MPPFRYVSSTWTALESPHRWFPASFVFFLLPTSLFYNVYCTTSLSDIPLHLPLRTFFLLVRFTFPITQPFNRLDSFHQVRHVSIRKSQSQPFERLFQKIQILRIPPTLAYPLTDYLGHRGRMAFIRVTQELGVARLADVDHASNGFGG